MKIKIKKNRIFGFSLFKIIYSYKVQYLHFAGTMMVRSFATKNQKLTGSQLLVEQMNPNGTPP